MTTRAPKNTSFALVSVTKNYHFLKKVSRGTPHTVPEQELKISKKWLYGNLDLLFEKTHSFCRVIILLHSNSQAHKVAHASLGPCFGQHSANFHRVNEYVTDIFLPKWALLKQCVPWVTKTYHLWHLVFSLLHLILTFYFIIKMRLEMCSAIICTANAWGRVFVCNENTSLPSTSIPRLKY